MANEYHRQTKWFPAAFNGILSAGGCLAKYRSATDHGWQVRCRSNAIVNERTTRRPDNQQQMNKETRKRKWVFFCRSVAKILFAARLAVKYKETKKKAKK